MQDEKQYTIHTEYWKIVASARADRMQPKPLLQLIKRRTQICRNIQYLSKLDLAISGHLHSPTSSRTKLTALRGENPMPSYYCPRFVRSKAIGDLMEDAASVGRPSTITNFQQMLGAPGGPCAASGAKNECNARVELRRHQ